MGVCGSAAQWGPGAKSLLPQGSRGFAQKLTTLNICYFETVLRRMHDYTNLNSIWNGTEINWRQKVDGQLPIMHSRLRLQWCCPPCQLAISACVCTLQENLSSLNIVLGSFVGNWRTRGLPIRGLVNSRTGQVAVSQMPPRERKLSTQSRWWHSRVVQSASWPVREMSSPRVVQ